MISTLLLTSVAIVTRPPAIEDPLIARTRLDLRVAEAVLLTYGEDAGPLPIDGEEPVRLDSLELQLAGTYGDLLPGKDAWDRPMRCWQVDGDLYLVSDGPDGIATFDPREEEPDQGDDIVLSEGEFEEPSDSTIASLISLGTALDSYAVDMGHYPGPTRGMVPVTQLEEALVPTYIRAIPAVDDWQRPILVYIEPAAYFLVSFGSDGRPDREYDPRRIGAWPVFRGPSASPTADVVFANGRLLQWTEVGPPQGE